MQNHVDRRDAPPSPFHIKTIILDDRFIRPRELRRLVPMNEKTYRIYEQAGRFPKRLLISKGRYAWIERELDLWLSDLPEYKTKRLKLGSEL